METFYPPIKRTLPDYKVMIRWLLANPWKQRPVEELVEDTILDVVASACEVDKEVVVQVVKILASKTTPKI